MPYHSDKRLSQSYSRTVSLEETQNRRNGWKDVLLLQFDKQFRIAVTAGILFSYFVITKEAATSLGLYNVTDDAHTYMTDTKGVLYAFDAFYVIDILFMIIFKNTLWAEVAHLYKSRSSIVLVIECLSLAPVDALYFQISIKKSEQIVRYLRLRYLLRIVRLLTDRRLPLAMTKQETMIKLTINFFMIISLTATTITFVLHPYTCRTGANNNCTTVASYYLNLYVAMERITGKGFGEITQHKYYSDSYTQAAITIISFLAYIILGYSTSKLVCHQITRDQIPFTFLIKITMMKKAILSWKYHSKNIWKNYHESFYSTFTDYYEIIWEKRKCSQSRALVESIIPKIMFKEIYLDLSWNALKHSHLFRDEDTHFLRKTAEYVRHRFHPPGEILFNKGVSKSCMIYVTSGVVQIISEENGETPIMSLSAGTCLGESSLFISYPANWTVVCKTYCELEVLNKNDFINVCKVYPEVYRNQRDAISERYAKAKHLRKIFAYQWKRGNVLNPDSITMIWIKQALRQLLDSDFAKDERIEFNDSYVFYAKFLDLYAITEEDELTADSIFLRKQCPVIFQPDSIFLGGWHISIALISSILVLFYPIYMVYCNSIGIVPHMILYTTVTIVWLLDIYVQVSTAVKTKEEFHTTMLSIAYYRVGTWTFLIDLISVLPFALILLLTESRIATETYILAEFHKLFKFYRVTILFAKMETLNVFLRITLKYVKAFTISFLLFYYTSAVFYYIICADINGCSSIYTQKVLNRTELKPEHKSHIIAHLYSLASLFIADITYFDFMKVIEHSKFLLILVVQMVYTFVNISILAFMAIVETLKEREHHKYKEFVTNLEGMAKDFELSYVIQKRLQYYLKSQYWLDKGFLLMTPALFKDNMSPNLYSLYRQVLYGKFLHNIPLFCGLEDKIIKEVTSELKVKNFPAGEVITYAGEVCKEMHVVELGYCSMRDTAKKVLKPRDSFCVLETCLQIPTFYTVITLTDCTILSLDYTAYSQITTRYPEFKNLIDATIEVTVDKEDIDKIAKGGETISEADFTLANHKKDVSFKSFYFSKDNRKQKNSLYKMEFSSFKVIFKYFLLRCTFTSDGRFLFFWEVFRCIFALMTSVMISFTKLCTNCTEFYILLMLDLTALLDIYMRHHVCYFNPMGIFVSHPMSTAMHYWQNGFLIDLIGVLPIDYFVEGRPKMYCRMNRVLQLHRAFGFAKYINDNNMTRSKLLEIAKYIPMTLLLVNYVSSINLYMTCNIMSDDMTDTNFRCSATHWKDTYLHPNASGSPRVQTHTSGLLLTTTNLALIGFTRVHIDRLLELFTTSVMILFGHIFFVWITARMVADNFYRKSDLTDYQEAMKQLLQFVSYRKVDKNIKREIIRYFEFMWFKTKGKELKTLIGSFNTALKEDILFDMFGRTMQDSSIFPNAAKSFFKSLLLEAKYEVYVNKGIIYRVNDVHGLIFFLLKGHVEVLGPDYNKLLILTSGSMFGTLDNCSMCRQTLMMVAKGNVEILKLSSTYFHTILSKYPVLDRNFALLTAVNVDYLENWNMYRGKDFGRSTKAHFNDTKFKKRNSLIAFYLRSTKLFEDTIYLKVWKTFVIIVACYFGFMLSLFHLATGDVSYYGFLMAYFMDGIYLSEIYLEFHTSYKNELGIPVRNRKLIARNYLRRPLGFYFDVVSSAPIEILALFAIRKSIFWSAWSRCRINRVIRIVHVFNTFKTNNEKLHVNITLMRVFYIICWISIILQTLTTLLFLFISADYDGGSRLDRLRMLGQTYMIIVSTASGAALINQDITFNTYTAVCVIFIILVCRFLMTIFIAETCATIEAINQNRSTYQQFALGMKQYMTTEGISVPLRKRICQYINLLWTYHRGVQLPHLLREAPYYLQEAILNGMFGFHIRRHSLLKDCHVDLIRQMAAKFNVLVYFPENYVVYQGDNDQSMYFIHIGEVEVISEDTLRREVVKDVLRTGDVFGLDQGLFGSVGHPYTYKVSRYSIILGLERSKWIHLLQFFPASRAVINRKPKDERNKKQQHLRFK